MLKRSLDGAAAVCALMGVWACATIAAQEAQSLSIETLKALPAQSYRLQPETSDVAFALRPVAGRFEQASGEVVVHDAAAAQLSVRAEVALDTIALGNARFETMAQSAPWFDVANHPRAVFEGELLRWREDGVGEVAGNLTIRGQTEPAQFDVTLSCAELLGCPVSTVRFSGDLEISRADYGMTSLQGVVGDTVRLRISGTLVASGVVSNLAQVGK